MLLYIVALVLQSVCTIVSHAADSDVEHGTADVSTELTLATASSRLPSNNQKGKVRRQGKPWTATQREKFQRTIETREKTDAMRETWRTKGFSGKKHSDETKLLISMRKQGAGRLPDRDLKRRRYKSTGGQYKSQKRPLRTDASRKAMSDASKERWAKLRAHEEQTRIPGESATGELSRLRKVLSNAAKERWAKVRATEDRRTAGQISSMHKEMEVNEA